MENRSQGAYYGIHRGIIIKAFAYASYILNRKLRQSLAYLTIGFDNITAQTMYIIKVIFTKLMFSMK